MNNSTGTAIGCTTPVAPKNTRIKFIGKDVAQVSCGRGGKGYPDKHFRLHCVHNKWIGKAINCTYGYYFITSYS